MKPTAAESYFPEAGPRYDMTAEEARHLCIELLERQPLRPATEFESYTINGRDHYSGLGRYVESVVFHDTFGNTPDFMHREYGPYEQASNFMVIVDPNRQMPVGALRAITNSPAGLKSLNDLQTSPLHISSEEVCQKYQINTDRCVDVGTLAVLPEYRANAKGNIFPSLLLYRSLYRQFMSRPDIDHTVMIIDKRAEKGLNRLGLPFQPIDERYFNYLDSPQSRALFGVNEQFYSEVTAKSEKLAAEGFAENDPLKQLTAWAMKELAEGTTLDDMIAN